MKASIVSSNVRSSATWLVAVTGAALAPWLSGCGERATASDCTFIFDRLVELRLEERGFRDPALRDRRTRELRGRFRIEIDQCEGHRLPSGARDCVAKARTVEEVSQGCLR
jgi:hypothetical protein